MVISKRLTTLCDCIVFIRPCEVLLFPSCASVVISSMSAPRDKGGGGGGWRGVEVKHHTLSSGTSVQAIQGSNPPPPGIYTDHRPLVLVPQFLLFFFFLWGGVGGGGGGGADPASYKPSHFIIELFSTLYKFNQYFTYIWWWCTQHLD